MCGNDHYNEAKHPQMTQNIFFKFRAKSIQKYPWKIRIYPTPSFRMENARKSWQVKGAQMSNNMRTKRVKARPPHTPLIECCSPATCRSQIGDVGGWLPMFCPDSAIRWWSGGHWAGRVWAVSWYLCQDTRDHNSNPSRHILAGLPEPRTWCCR